MIFGLCVGVFFFLRDTERDGETVVTITLKSILCVLVEVLSLSSPIWVNPSAPCHAQVCLSDWNHLLNIEAGWRGFKRYTLGE